MQQDKEQNAQAQQVRSHLFVNLQIWFRDYYQPSLVKETLKIILNNLYFLYETIKIAHNYVSKVSFHNK